MSSSNVEKLQTAFRPAAPQQQLQLQQQVQLGHGRKGDPLPSTAEVVKLSVAYKAPAEPQQAAPAEKKRPVQQQQQQRQQQQIQQQHVGVRLYDAGSDNSGIVWAPQIL